MIKSEIRSFFYKSPIGILEIRATEEFILRINFVKRTGILTDKKFKIVDKLFRQLDEYFSGKRKHFDINYLVVTSNFQEKVLKAVNKIPYGETKSYLQIAKLIKNPKAARAVGTANKNNPIPIIIPCHRVIGSDGELKGYAGKNGLSKKAFLLKLEKSINK